MATPHACAALADVFPTLLRARRQIAGATTTPPLLTLAVVLEHGPSRVSEIAEHLALDLSTVSRQVAHLRQQGLVESTPDPDDGRSLRVAISAGGIDVLRAQRRAVVDKLLDRLATWDDAEVTDLTRLLHKLGRDTCQDPTPADPGDRAPHDPAPHDPAPHDPAPHDPAPHDPAPHDPAPAAHHQEAPQMNRPPKTLQRNA